MKTIRLFFAVFLLMALCSLTTLQAQTNLVTNPGFEAVTDGVPDGWTLETSDNGASGAVTFESVTNPVYEGNKSLKIASTDYVDGIAYQYISVTPGKKYNMSAWFNIESYEEEYGAYASFGYQFTDANGTNIGSTRADFINEDRIKNTWREFKHANVTAPTGAVYLKIIIFTQYHIVAYFDNASVTEVGAVSKQDQTISGLSNLDKTVGDADFNLSATATSDLTVSYSSSNTAVATISGSTVHIVGAGTTTITASQAGNDTYNAATDVTATLTVGKASQIITGLSNMDKTVGDADFNLSATASSNLAVTYASSNENVATISGSTVHIVGAGTTTITASQAGNENYNAATPVTATLTVTIPVTEVTLNRSTLSLSVGSTEILTATVTPVNATNKNIIWSSSDASVATVDDSGRVTALATGTATISVITLDGNKTATCSLTVTPATISVTGVVLNKQTLSLSVGSSETLAATVTPVNATNKNASWSSSAVNIATVDNTGKVTAISAGSASISVTTIDGSKTASCAVTVNKVSQTISGLSDITKKAGDADFTLSATTSSGLTVTYASSNTAVATINGSTVHIVGAGTTTITASQAGNDTYNAATPLTAKLTVSAIDGLSEVRTLLPVRIANSKVFVTTQAGSNIEVFNILGTKVCSLIATDTETEISGLPKNQILIVRSGNAVAKVIL
jgi:uncharacterized protein YjdB